MARIARLVVPNVPHHVTQRGNRRQKTSFFREDYRTYIALVSEAKREADAQEWPWSSVLKTGLPLGSDLFIKNLERLTGRDLGRSKPESRRQFREEVKHSRS